MNKTTNRPLVPRLRFPEFRDAGAWERKRLGDIADGVTNRADANDPSDVLTLSAEQGVMRQDEYFGKKIAGNEVSRYIKVNQFDFIYNDRTTKQFKYGAIKRIERFQHGIVSPIYKCFRYNTDEETAFWKYYFDGCIHEAALGDLVNEGARQGRFNISIKSFLGISVISPAALEQQKISDCLTSLDARIDAENHKLEQLRQHKQGLLQKLFPAEGEDVPELRFPEFATAGKWEKKPLGSCFSERLERSATGELISVTINDGIKKFCELSRHDNSSEDKSRYKCIEHGDIAYNTMRMWQGASGYSPYKGIVSPAYTVIIPRHGFDGIFFSFLFKKSNLIDLFLRYSQGVTSDTWTLKFPTFSRITANIPSYSEQQKIADCLTSLDACMDAQAQKVDLLKQHKQGLLQQLFPQE